MNSGSEPQGSRSPTVEPVQTCIAHVRQESDDVLSPRQQEDQWELANGNEAGAVADILPFPDIECVQPVKAEDEHEDEIGEDDEDGTERGEVERVFAEGERVESCIADFSGDGCDRGICAEEEGLGFCGGDRRVSQSAVVVRILLWQGGAPRAYRCCARARFNTLTTVAAARALATTIQ